MGYDGPMDRFRVLPGLPATGPMYVPFSATGMGKHSEGFVVEFLPGTAESWVGTFAKGGTKFSAAAPHPDGKSVVVISRGEGYVVDPETRALTQLLGSDVEGLISVPQSGQLILQGTGDFTALGPSGRSWQTPRLAYGGFGEVKVVGARLLGLADDGSDEGAPFEVDLETGASRGGIKPL